VLTVKIGGTPYIIDEPAFKLSPKLAERWKCTIYIWDYTGTVFFTYLMKVTVDDPVLGRLFTGFVAADIQDKSNTYPHPTTLHQIDCFDPRRLAENRTSNRVYTTPTFAGKIAADLVSDVLAAEGVLANYATQFVTTQNDWNSGTLSNVVGTSNVGDGDLELVGSSSVSASYLAQNDWNVGVFSNARANAGGDVSLIGVTRNYDDGVFSGQTLFGNGSPTQDVSSGVYELSCKKSSETRSRLDFAGLWSGNWTAEVDINVHGDVPKFSITWGTTTWNNNDDYAYAIELKSQSIEIRRGSNGSGGGNSQLAIYTFSTKLANGWYRVRVVKSGNTYTVYVNGIQRLSVTDSTYTAAAYLALRNRNGEPSVSIVDQFDNFGIMQAKSGTWTGPSTSIGAITTIASSIITWDTPVPAGGTLHSGAAILLVQTSTNGGSTYQTASNGGSIPGLTPGSSGAGKNVRVKVTLSTSSTGVMPDIANLRWAVIGGYVASGSRSTVPLAIDYMDRANQSGLGTADDGQTYTKVGTGTDAIASNEATITNTTGDLFERLGSKTAGDSEDSTRFQLSVSTISAGIVLRYVDSNNWCLLKVTTTALAIIMCLAGTQYILATVSVSLLTVTWYRMRFRIAGNGPTNFYGRVWTDMTVEPPAWNVTAVL